MLPDSSTRETTVNLPKGSTYTVLPMMNVFVPGGYGPNTTVLASLNPAIVQTATNPVRDPSSHANNERLCHHPRIFLKPEGIFPDIRNHFLFEDTR